MSDELAPLDVYADQFSARVDPFGCTLNYFRSKAVTPPAQDVPIEHVATVRMSLEHLKIMSFLLYRQIRSCESSSGACIPVSPKVLNTLQVGLEDWDQFWNLGHG